MVKSALVILRETRTRRGLRPVGHRPRYRGAFGGAETWGTHKPPLRTRRRLLWLGLKLSIETNADLTTKLYECAFSMRTKSVSDPIKPQAFQASAATTLLKSCTASAG